jgi:hypothetical protein
MHSGERCALGTESEGGGLQAREAFAQVGVGFAGGYQPTALQKL